MDWLEGLNKVVKYIEENLTNTIQMETLAKILYCSVHDFSRIFSLAAGMSVSEYIRRRRLSQAVFDIQNGKESITDISLKYCYESQSTFTRAFKELHGQTPASARKNGISLKTYPKITFKFIIRGVIEMDFRIENKESFKIIGFSCKTGNREDWNEFLANYNKRLRNDDSWGGLKSYYHAPLWQTEAYSYNHAESENASIIGAELSDKPVLDGMDVKTFPSATYAVFTFTSKAGETEAGEAYAQIMTEWLPASNYEIDETSPKMEVYLPGGIPNSDEYKWETWLPVIKK